MTDVLSGPDLGPSVLPEFEGAPALDEIASEKPDRKVSTKPVTPLPSVELPEAVFVQTVEQIDRTVSALVKVDPLDEDNVKGIADGLYPLANYYASQEASVTTLWLVAGLTVLSYAALKYQQIGSSPQPEEESENGETNNEKDGQ